MQPSWHIQIYYGVSRGRYLSHLEIAGRQADNNQTEGMNDRLEGFLPLIRVKPGSYLGERPEILSLLDNNDERLILSVKG